MSAGRRTPPIRVLRKFDHVDHAVWADKSDSTLQPDDGKLHHAAKLAQDGDHHDQKKGQAKREQEKSESGGKKPMSVSVICLEKLDHFADVDASRSKRS